MAGMRSVKTKWWWPYLTIQAIAIFHFLYPLPYHYRHTVAKWAALPVMPGVLAAWLADACIRSGSVTRIFFYPPKLADTSFLLIGGELINCGLFAVVVMLANRYRQRRAIG